MKIRATDVRIITDTAFAQSAVCCDTSSEPEARAAARSALERAESSGGRVLAFASPVCAPGGLTALAAAKIIAQEIFRHLRAGTSRIEAIHLCAGDETARQAYEQGALRYLEHILQDMCWGPFVTVDAIIERSGGVVLIQRSNPPLGWALPGGFVDYGESLEDAVRREVREETNLYVARLRQVRTYSDPRRDPRFHTVGTVFAVDADGELRAGDDAAGVRVAPWDAIEALEIAFDHKQILLEYRRNR